MSSVKEVNTQRETRRKESAPTAASGQGVLGSEDWWAVFIGLGIVAFAILLWLAGQSLNLFAAKIPSWSNWAFLFNGGEVTKDGETSVVAGLIGRLPNIIALFVLFAAVFTIAAHFLKLRTSSYLAGFTVLFVLSFVVNVFSSSKFANSYNLEAPLVALAIGLILGNLFNVERLFGGALRTELYVKVGIILLGATLPFTTILKAGPIALAHATVVAVSTFLIIYFVATKVFSIDKRFAATLGAGGSICGVSAGIAVGSAVKARKEQVSAAISIVVVWAIIAIFLLTALAKGLGLPDGVAGAWVGTSEFADAAGITAASSFGDQGIAAFTLVKVQGRRPRHLHRRVEPGAVHHRHHVLGQAGPHQGSQGRRQGCFRTAQGENRCLSDLAPLPEVRHRLLHRVHRADHRDRGVWRGGIRRYHGESGDPGEGTAHLGVHVHVPFHRPDHAFQGTVEPRLEAHRGVQHRGRGEHHIGIRAFRCRAA